MLFGMCTVKTYYKFPNLVNCVVKLNSMPNDTEWRNRKIVYTQIDLSN